MQDNDGFSMNILAHHTNQFLRVVAQKKKVIALGVGVGLLASLVYYTYVRDDKMEGGLSFLASSSLQATAPLALTVPEYRAMEGALQSRLRAISQHTQLDEATRIMALRMTFDGWWNRHIKPIPVTSKEDLRDLVVGALPPTINTALLSRLKIEDSAKSPEQARDGVVASAAFLRSQLLWLGAQTFVENERMASLTRIKASQLALVQMDVRQAGLREKLADYKTIMQAYPSSKSVALPLQLNLPEKFIPIEEQVRALELELSDVTRAHAQEALFIEANKKLLAVYTALAAQAEQLMTGQDLHQAIAQALDALEASAHPLLLAQVREAQTRVQEIHRRFYASARVETRPITVSTPLKWPVGTALIAFLTALAFFITAVFADALRKDTHAHAESH